MGFLDFLNINKSNIKKIDEFKGDKCKLAEELFNYNEYGTYGKEVKKILKELKNNNNSEELDRQDVFLKVIDIIGEPRTPKELELVARSYLFSRFPYNKEGLKWALKYLNSNINQEAEIVVVPEYVKDTMENRIKIVRSFWNSYIVEYYEREHNFEEALKYAKESIEIAPFFQSTYIVLSRIYSKKNELDKSLEVLKMAKRNIYYSNPDYKECIDRYIEKTKAKIEKGYKYKPRKASNIDMEELYNMASKIQKKYLVKLGYYKEKI